MGWVRVVVGAFSLGLGLVGTACVAQGRYATDALEHGRLVVWVVQPAPSPKPTADQVRATLHTATAGSFGRTAGSVGQTAGSYGTSVSGVSTVDSGKTAGEVGQTAGSFGQSLDTIADAGTAATTAAAAGSPAFEPATLGGAWESVARRIREAFPDLQLRFVAVSAADLKDRFAAIGHGVDGPDVLLSETPLSRQNSFLSEVTLASLGTAAEGMEGERSSRREWLVVTGAAHPAEARALAVWIEDGMVAHAERDPVGDAVTGPVGVAVSAVEGALRGNGIEPADPEMAKVPPGAVRWSAFVPPTGESVNGLSLRADALAGESNERFAVYRLRVIASSPRAFGVVHPLVVLRRGEGGRWGVLQLSGNVGNLSGDNEFGELRPFARVIKPDWVKSALGVKLAAPPDGDTRVGMPELWWDDPGDSSLLLVEWQNGVGDTHLQFVPERAERLQVRVPASFGGSAGAYRWRVWAMGAGGLVTLSPWRRVTILQ